MTRRLRKLFVVTLHRHQNQAIEAGILKEDTEVAHARLVGAVLEVANVPEEGRAKVGQEARSVRKAKSMTRVKTLKATASNQKLHRKSSSEGERKRREMNTKVHLGVSSRLSLFAIRNIIIFTSVFLFYLQRLPKSIHQVFVSS